MIKKQWWTGAIIAIAIIAPFVIYQTMAAPRDLGPKLEYVGTYNSGCEWWQIPFYFGWCAGPSNEYYFATDMKENELKQYFSRASSLEKQDGSGGFSANYTFKEIDFTTKNNDTFGVYYYDNTSAVISDLHLKKLLKLTSLAFPPPITKKPNPPSKQKVNPAIPDGVTSCASDHRKLAG